MQFLLDTIRDYPEIAIYITLALGFWIGGIRLWSFSLGSVTSTLLAGLLVGQLHVPIAPVVQATFFLMFLFAVGYGVGPQFFRALKKDGLPQIVFSLLLCVSGLACAYGLGKLLGYDPGITAGLLAGGYTNSGTLGVASANLKQLGLDADHTAAMASLAAIAYAVTYPFGTAGAAWFLASLGPKILGVDLAASCKELESTMGSAALAAGIGTGYHTLSTRAYGVDNPALIGLKACDVGGMLGTSQALVIRVRQDGAITETTQDTVVHGGARLVVAGHPQSLLAAGTTVGQEVDDAELLGYPTEKLDVVVTKKQGESRTIGDLQDAELARSGRGVFVYRLKRGGQEIDATAAVRILHRDVLTLVGAQVDIENAATFFGYADRVTSTSDIAFMSAGIVIGAIVGAVTIHVGGIPLSFSPTVGALVAGLVCGYLRSIYRTFGRIPDPALWVFNNVGLNGFIAVVGLNAAPGLVAGLRAYGIQLFLSGIVVSIVPLVIGLFAGKYIFKFHPGILLGACAGARTTTAALGALQEASNSRIPAIGYTVPYAVARVAMAVFGVFIVLAMK